MRKEKETVLKIHLKESLSLSNKIKYLKILLYNLWNVFVFVEEKEES